MAQPTFEKYYQSPTSLKLDLFELNSRNYFIGLGGAVLLDPAGDIIHKNYYWGGDSVLGLRAVARYTDNEFYFATGYQNDSCTANGSNTVPYIHPLIGKMDSLGNLSSVHYYVLNAPGCSAMAIGLEVCGDGSVVSWGGGGPFFFLKTDPTGNPLWAKRILRSGNVDFVKELPGGDLLAGISMDTAGVVVARMNAAGEVLWCKSYIRPNGEVHDVVIEPDGSFIITGVTEVSALHALGPLPSTYHPKTFMLKLDGEGAVLWCRGYAIEPYLWYAPQWSRIIRTPDNKYVVLATIGVQSGGLNYNRFYRPFLMKTDLNGDTLWTRSGGLTDYKYEIQDLLLASDGGLLFSGLAHGDFPTALGAPYLFKADSTGHLPCSEQQPPPLSVTELFPVDSNFVIASIDGAVSVPFYLNDTSIATIPTYGCMITSVMDPSRSRKPKVYPNPTPGRFTVEFQDPLVKDSYYSVYDAMGKLLFQRAATHGQKTEEVDLTGYSKGTYVIRFTDKEGTCYERVVVE